MRRLQWLRRMSFSQRIRESLHNSLKDYHCWQFIIRSEISMLEVDQQGTANGSNDWTTFYQKSAILQSHNLQYLDDHFTSLELSSKWGGSERPGPRVRYSEKWERTILILSQEGWSVSLESVGWNTGTSQHWNLVLESNYNSLQTLITQNHFSCV